MKISHMDMIRDWRLGRIWGEFRENHILFCFKQTGSNKVYISFDNL